MKSVLLLLPSRTYRAGTFMDAAGKIGAGILTASESDAARAKLASDGMIQIDFSRPEEAAGIVAAFAGKTPIDAVVAVDELSTAAAAHIARRLGLPGNPPAAARAARDKTRMRALLAEAKIPCARYKIFQAEDNPLTAASALPFPCVLKPARLSASRGVIRADDAGQFAQAFRRIRKLLDRPDVAEKCEGDRRIIVEEYLPGSEVAVDGLMEGDRLRPLAIFDKPDALEGPYFEETIYTTPSRHPEQIRGKAIACAQAAARALGLSRGAIHAELRINEKGVFLIELAARSIGGLCSRILRFESGATLEEMILRNALGQDLGEFTGQALPAGVMMLPIPHTGTFRALEGIAHALAVPGIEDCALTAYPGKTIEALPDGGEYLGFLFARAGDPESVEAALRAAHAKLQVKYA